LDGEIGDEVRCLLVDIASRAGISLIELAVIADHAHLLVALSSAQTLPGVIHQLKGASARAIFQRYPELKRDLRSNSFWQKGYGRRLVPPSQVAVVRAYIRTQHIRPLRHALA